MRNNNQNRSLQQAVRLMMQNSSYYFSRSFFQVYKNRTAVNIVNRLFENEKEMEPTLLALSLFPAIMWMLGAEDLDFLTSKIYLEDKSDGVESLEKSKIMIMEILGCEPKIVMENRKKYFSVLHEFADYLLDRINAVAENPTNGQYYGALLKYFYMEKTPDFPVTSYTINLYLPDAIRQLHKIAGEKIAVYINSILKEDEPIGNEELQYIYHNISLLIDEYSKIRWDAKNCDDKAVRLLACSSEDEMLAITESDSRYSQAYIIVQYITLIHNAIERLRTFPQHNIYNVVSKTIQYRQSQYSDFEIALMLNIPLSRYRQSIRIGMAALSAELFGLSCNVFLDMLTGC